MAVWGLWILCGGRLLATAVRSDLSIRGCEQGSVDAVEDTDPSFTCGEYWIQGPQWTVYNNKRQKLYSGSCTGRSCTSSNNQFRLNEVWYEKSNMYTSRLTIKKITRDSARKLVCSYSSSNASCDLRIIAPAILKSCDVSIWDWWVHATCVAEHMYASDERYSCSWRVNNDELTSYFHDALTGYRIDTRAYRKGVCSATYTMLYSPGNYTYSIKIDPGLWNTVKTLNIVPPGDPMYTCPDVVYEGSSINCTCTSSNPGSPPAKFVWDRLNSNILHIHNVQLENNGNEHTCFMTWGPNRHIHQVVLTLKVAVPVSIVPQTCRVQLSRWKVQGVCTIQWLDTISDTSACRWRVSYQSFLRTAADDLKRFLSSSSFVTVNSVGYNRRECSFEQKMPVIEGNYSYSISVSSHPDDQFSKSLCIEKPEEPRHNCSKMLLEGSNITCRCFTLNLGNPPAQVRWAESGNEHFVIEGLNRERNGTVTTCNLTWGVINYTTSYTINVAFGPSVTDISSSKETTGDETKTVLVCTAVDVHPSAFFRWNISCEKETQNENTSRCTLSTARVADQMTIECTASNQIFEEVSSTSIYILKPTHNPFKGEIIAGSVAAVLVLVVVVAVIIVCIKRRKVVNRNKTQTPIVRFAAPSGDIYTIAGTTTVDHREDEYVTVRDTTYLDNIPKTQTSVVRSAAPSGDLYSIAGPATAREVNQVTIQESIQNRTYATKVTGYMNVTEVPTDSGLGVYHDVPWAAISEKVSSDARVLDTSKISEDEYNVLRFQEDRTGQEDHAVTYSHLDIK